MNKVLIDTNIWVDVILRRPTFYDDSYGTLLACIEDEIPMVVAGTSVKDIFCWAQKSAGSQAAYDALDFVFKIADVAAVDEPVCKSALQLGHPDYEDGIIAACAQAESVNIVITRDEKAFSDIDVLKLSPKALLEKQGWQHIPLG